VNIITQKRISNLLVQFMSVKVAHSGHLKHGMVNKVLLCHFLQFICFKKY